MFCMYLHVSFCIFFVNEKSLYASQPSQLVQYDYIFCNLVLSHWCDLSQAPTEIWTQVTSMRGGGQTNYYYHSLHISAGQGYPRAMTMLYLIMLSHDNCTTGVEILVSICPVDVFRISLHLDIFISPETMSVGVLRARATSIL